MSVLPTTAPAKVIVLGQTASTIQSSFNLPALQGTAGFIKKGKVDKAAGTVKDKVGDAADAAKDVVGKD